VKTGTLRIVEIGKKVERDKIQWLGEISVGM
jgi:hypothetical protein